MKIYCKNCKYIKRTSLACGFECRKPIGTEVIENYYSKTRKRIYPQLWLVNQNNACGYYKRKWWKFWI